MINRLAKPVHDVEALPLASAAPDRVYRRLETKLAEWPRLNRRKSLIPPTLGIGVKKQEVARLINLHTVWDLPTEGYYTNQCLTACGSTGYPLARGGTAEAVKKRYQH